MPLAIAKQLNGKKPAKKTAKGASKVTGKR
jgi:hypothetical protein